MLRFVPHYSLLRSTVHAMVVFLVHFCVGVFGCMCRVVHVMVTVVRKTMCAVICLCVCTARADIRNDQQQNSCEQQHSPCHEWENCANLRMSLDPFHSHSWICTVLTFVAWGVVNISHVTWCPIHSLCYVVNVAPNVWLLHDSDWFLSFAIREHVCLFVRGWLPP